MHKKHFRTIPNVVHFKKWTNRAVAVLISLKSVVNISVLDYRMSGLLGDKTKSFTDIFAQLFLMTSEMLDQDLEEQFTIAELVSVPVIADHACDYGATFLYTTRSAQSCSGFFYFLTFEFTSIK